MTIAEPVSICTSKIRSSATFALCHLYRQETSVEEATTSLPTLPFVQAGLITFEVVPLAPYPGVARLFAAYGEPGGSPSIS